MNTFMKKKDNTKLKWYLIDGKDIVLGRIATKISEILRGKNEPDYTPHVEGNTGVIVINAEKIKVTGNKVQDKVYWKHTNHPGGMNYTNYAEYMEKDPTFPIIHAVKGMISKNKMRKHLLRKLKVFVGENHNLEAQKPEQIQV